MTRTALDSLAAKRYFADCVLAVLESDEEWSGDTLDVIAADAQRLGLATLDDRGMFVRSPLATADQEQPT